MKSIAFDLTIILYLLAMLTGLLGLVWGRKRSLLLGGDFLYLTGLIANGVYIAHRWQVAGRAPLQSAFELLVFSAAGVALLYAILRAMVKIDYLGVFPAAVSLICVAYSTLLDWTIEPLVPALQNSFWLTIHVLLCVLGYGAFVVAFVGGLAFLMGSGSPHRAGAVFVFALVIVGVGLAFGLPWAIEAGTVQLQISWTSVGLVAVGAAGLAALISFPLVDLFARAKVFDFLAEKPEIDLLVYRAVGFGFPLLGLGIVAGAIWADQAWGSYWSWDPKETASLVTWLVYSLYLHLRYLAGWKGPRATWVAVGGFSCVLFTWLGVNYLLSGLHAYA